MAIIHNTAYYKS